MNPTTKLWVTRTAIVLLAIFGTLALFGLPFPWNLFVFALLLSIALILWIVLTAQTKNWAEGVVMAIPVVLGLGAFLGNFTNFAKAIGWIKPTYGISIEPSAITLNKVAHVKLIASYADGTTPSLDGYRCRWKFNRSPPSAPTDELCAIDITDTPDLFKDKDPVSFDLGINVEPIPPGSSKPAQVDQTRAYTLTMYNYSAPRVDITPNVLELGQTAPAKFSFPQGVVPTDRNCSWSPSEQFQKPNDCETTFVAPRNSGLYPDGIVLVQVTVTTGDLKLSSETFRVTVHYPPAKLFDFVLDATTNMKPVMDGIALLDRAKASINSQILRLQPTGGWLAIVGFGHDIPGVRDDCDRYKPVYPLARINAPEADTALKDVRIAGQIAPLAKAIDTAVKQYSDLRPFYPNKEVEGYLVLLTASANGCQNMALADAIAEVETAFRNNGLQVQYYGQTVFTSVIAVPTQGTRPNQVYSTPAYQSERNRTILIVADSPKDIEDAVTAITNLSDADFAVRQRGCNTLRQLLIRYNDRKGVTILNQQQQCRG